MNPQLPEIAKNVRFPTSLNNGFQEDEKERILKVENENRARKKKNSPNSKAPINFSDVCDEMPPTKNAFLNPKGDLSVHSCFVAILHLANEKSLRFSKEGGDFRIFKEVAVD